MALIHHAKVTHYFSPSPQHLGTFFRSLTTLYAEQRHTDLLLVAAASHVAADKNNGIDAAADTQSQDPPARSSVVFGTHQMILASCSTFVKDLIEATAEGCQCETLTIFLPDFHPDTIKNFLSILYTGSSIGNCDLKELKCLMETLKIDTRNLSVKSQRDESDESFPDVSLQNNPFESDVDKKSRHQPNLADFNFPQMEESKDSNGLGNETDSHNQDEINKELLEVTPEVQFFGNHFLAGDDEEEEAASEPKAKIPKINGSETSSMIEQTMARHKEMTMAQYRQHNVVNGAPASDSVPSMTNGKSPSTSSVSNILGMNLMMGGNAGSLHDGEDNKNYNCRLCGKMSGNGASLFAHLLYPHYAHLWREEVPHRAQRYDCKECNYSTVKRQHFVMHVARVHDELRKKLAALGENLEVLDNLTQKSQNSSNERIVSTIAKGINMSEDANDDSMQTLKGLEGSLSENINGVSPNFVNDQMLSEKLLNFEQGSRFPRGFKPFVKCRLCGKSWKGKDNFFTHLVSTHFKYLWAKEVPRQADMFRCHVSGCRYQSKYRYNFLFHLAGKHKQLKMKLAQEGIPLNVLNPIESDSGDFNETGVEDVNNSLVSGAMNPSDILRQSKMLLQNDQHHMRTPPSALKHSEPRPSGGSNNTRLICRVCTKVSLNHTCHRQHVVGKHFYEFWAHLTADGMGIFNCHHIECTYKTPNRSVFIIHLAYVHQELKNKLIASGKDPNCVVPDVYGKRKYRRAYYDNTQHSASFGGQVSSPAGSLGEESSPLPRKSYRGPRDRSSTTSSSSPLSPASNSSGVPVQCTVCKNEYPSQRKAIEHLAVSHFHHVWAESSGGPFCVPSSGPFSCQHCSFTHVSRQTFICHIVSDHNALKHILANQFNGEKSIDDLIIASRSNNLGDEEDIEDEDEVLDEEDEDIENEEEDGLEEVEDDGIEDLEELEDEDDLDGVTMASQENNTNELTNNW